MNTTELIKDLAKVKRKQEPLWKYMRATKHPKGDRIRSCGAYLELREWLDHDGKCTVQSANFCMNHVMCNMCAIRRSAKLCQAYEEKINQVMETPGQSDLIPVMLTFTIKNREDITDALNHLKINFGKLWKRSRNQLRRVNPPESFDELCKVAGGVYSIEIKRGKGGLWHPHIHMFALLTGYVDQEKLSSEWLEMTGDSFIVGVTKCDNGIMAGLIEVLKYTTKFSEMEPVDIVEIADCAQGKTLTSNLGILRGVAVDIGAADDQLDGDYIDYIAHFMYRKNGYRLKLKAEVHDTTEAIMERHKRRTGSMKARTIEEAYPLQTE